LGKQTFPLARRKSPFLNHQKNKNLLFSLKRFFGKYILLS